MLRTTKWHPDQPLPKYADKATAAAIVTHLFFPISPRTLEKWPLVVRRPNKAAIFELQNCFNKRSKNLKPPPLTSKRRCER